MSSLVEILRKVVDGGTCQHRPCQPRPPQPRRRFHGLRHLTGNSQPEQKITTPGPWDDSKVWCTLGQGITNEVYYPQADTPNVRDGQYLVSDGSVSPTKSVTFDVLPGMSGADSSFQWFRLVGRLSGSCFEDRLVPMSPQGWERESRVPLVCGRVRCRRGPWCP